MRAVVDGERIANRKYSTRRSCLKVSAERGVSMNSEVVSVEIRREMTKQRRCRCVN